MIYEIFSNNLKNPDAIAIVNSMGETFTYAMVNRRVNQWANYLINLGIEEGDWVGFLFDNEDHHVFAFLAMDRINAVPVTFDADSPELQLAMDVSTLNLKKFIIEDTLVDRFKINKEIEFALSPGVLQTIYTSDGQPPPRIYNTNGFKKLAYGVFSSGSTGSKKLIPILGAGLKYWAGVEQALVKPSTGKLLSTRSPAYDARIFEYVSAFCVGGELHLLNRFQRRDLSSILAVCKTQSISSILLIASQLSAENSERIVTELKCSGLIHLMVTGDACTPYLQSLCEKIKLNLWNCYGPTESTFGLSILLVNDLKTGINALGLPIVPIGKPYGNEVRHHLIEGKLYIESPYLTPGYLDPKKNDLAFKSLELANGEQIRLFNTGDDFYEQDGYLFFLGRDHCKINGEKIYPKDVQERIHEYSKYPDGKALQAAVVIKKHLGEEKLFAYLVTPPDFDKEHFLTYLSARIKNGFPILLKIQSIPILGTSQKTDIRQLVARQDNPEDFFFQTHANSTVTSNARLLEESDCLLGVKRIWCELFKCEDLSTDFEFLYLGGTSILLNQMVIKIQEELDSTYNFQTLLSLPKITIQSIANSIFEKKAYSSEQAFIHQLINVGPGKPMFLLPALLGEGYFSYQELAKCIAKKFDCNIYGLSDPGITDEKLLPKNMAHAVSRYIRAIKSIQPRGPYDLCGFSFGATLAYEITKQLMLDGEEVMDLHLLDGYPPLLFQTLPDSAYANLLQALIDFIIVTLNNDYYAEHLTPIKLDDYSKLNKVQQVEHSCRELELRLSKPASKNLLSIAKCHLLFLLQAKKPDKKLFGVWPTLYLTNEQQPYLNVIKEVPHLSQESVGYHYYLWSEYFHNVTRSCKMLKGDHLSVLRSHFSEENHDPSYFWDRDPKWFTSIKRTSDFSIQSFYHLTPLEATPDCKQVLSVFFIPRFFAYFFANQLSSIQLFPRVICHDLNFQNSLRDCVDENDTSFSSQANLFCVVPFSKINQVRTLLKEQNIYMPCIFREAPRKILPSVKQKLMIEQSGEINLVILWNHTVLLTISFKYYSLPSLIIDELQQLGFSSAVLIDKTNIIYHHKIETALGTLQDAILSVENILADFISILAPHVAEEISLESCAEKRFCDLLCQEMTHYLKAFSAEADPITFKELTTLPNKWTPYRRNYRYCPTRNDVLILKESDYVSQVALRLCYHHCAEIIGKKVLGFIVEIMLKEFSMLYPDEISLQKSRFFKTWKFFVPWFEIEEFAIKENILALLKITPDVVEKTLNQSQGIFRKERSASIRTTTFQSLWCLNRGFFGNNLGDLPRGQPLSPTAPEAVFLPLAPAPPLMEI